MIVGNKQMLNQFKSTFFRFSQVQKLLSSQGQLVQSQTKLFSVEQKKLSSYQNGPNSWGTEYNAEGYKMEQEWNKIYEKVTADTISNLKLELSEPQMQRVELFLDEFLKMSKQERLYFTYKSREKTLNATGIDFANMNMHWPVLRQQEIGTWPPNNPNWFNGLANASMSMGGGGSSAASSTVGATKETSQEKKVEEVKEKSHYDIELSKFDPAKKIILIKEVRAILNLGLKEAKEMVEGAPCWIKKEVAKEEAEKLAEKLKELGAECRLA
ncbi:ribosomal protein l7 l12 c-terminal domain containing protein [Stylonychia lemnae]|uniref:Ribosomal protein l7 l12 c-terminal domain containing protein n=1 Tax=Stylonychia lemnae TaxID=5949 RepID=A0A078B0J4_STYLE|nr:ribosomal protein l7 l12 c-terminal domain containing protein [Stylonychia lemnae]|eukprot:CDW86882.1 ribosomal protein l7 l12 c-terminal domain containing protein [Stylonychia lemnae]